MRTFIWTDVATSKTATPTAAARKSRRRRRAAAIATAAIVVLSLPSTTTALQSASSPQPVRSHRESSTSLDYVSVAFPEAAAAAAVTDATKRSTASSAMANWEQLLRLETSMAATVATSTAASFFPKRTKRKKQKQTKQEAASVTTTATATASKRKNTPLVHRSIPSKRTTETATATKNIRRKQQRTADKPTLNDQLFLESALQLKVNPTALLTREQEILYTHRIHLLKQAEHKRPITASSTSTTTMATTTATSAAGNNTITTKAWAAACGYTSYQLHKILSQGHDARHQLMSANVGLVTSIAKRYYAALKYSKTNSFTLQDYLQEGQLGLMEAAERFDPQRGVRFATYATWWIRQRILKSITDSSRIIRLPAHVHQTLQRIKKAKIQMAQEIGREPSLPELAHYLELPVAKLQQYTQAANRCNGVLSLENPLRSQNNKNSNIEQTTTLGDVIASDAPTPQEHAQHQWLVQDLTQVLEEVLTEKERSVLKARYGLSEDSYGSPKSIQETSHCLGISREQVRLMEAKALNKLRSPQKNYRLQTYVAGNDSNNRVEEDGGTVHRKNEFAATNDMYNSCDATSRSRDGHARVNPFSSSSTITSGSSTNMDHRGRVVVGDNNAATGNDSLTALVNGAQGRLQQQDQREQHPQYHNLPPAPASDRLWFF